MGKKVEDFDMEEEVEDLDVNSDEEMEEVNGEFSDLCNDLKMS